LGSGEKRLDFGGWGDLEGHALAGAWVCDGEGGGGEEEWGLVVFGVAVEGIADDGVVVL